MMIAADYEDDPWVRSDFCACKDCFPYCGNEVRTEGQICDDCLDGNCEREIDE